MKIALFDLDGTLVDSEPDIHAAANVMLSSLGREVLDRKTVAGFVGNGVAKLVERCLDATGGFDAAGREEALALFNRAYAAAPSVLTRPYPGVPEALARFRDAGYALGVVTNKPIALAEAVLEGTELRAFFGVVFGGDSFPEMKPDPKPLLTAIERLGGGEAIYTGDSEVDEATAHNAGVPFQFFTEGYRRKEASEFSAAFTFSHYDELSPETAVAS